jgi:hypothetical protein
MVLFARQIALFIADLFRRRATLHAELVRMRHENAVLRRRAPKRIPLTNGDRMFLVWLHRIWPRLAKLSLLATPETLVRWHRAGFRVYWRWTSRRKRGRPKVDRELIRLIKRIARENVLWGAPRIHGELLKLGISVAQSTVAKYMPRGRRGDGGQSWRTFLANESDDIAAIDLLTVPTLGFSEIYALSILSPHCAPHCALCIMSPYFHGLQVMQTQTRQSLRRPPKQVTAVRSSTAFRHSQTAWSTAQFVDCVAPQGSR